MSQPNESSDSPSIHRDNEASTSFASNRESSGAATSSSDPLSVAREEDGRDRRGEDGNGFRESEIEQHQQQQEQQFGVNYGGNFFAFDDASAIRDETWSCVIVVLTFWFFVSMTLILGVYGSSQLTLGPNCSILIQPNPIFVQSIKVQELDVSTNGRLTLYAFYKSPSLDAVKNWSKIHNLSVPADSHKELTYFLNEGSQINISYSVNSPASSVFLVIAQGNEGLVQWLEDPTYPNTTLSWNVIHGSGTIQQDITKSSSYYVAVGNLNSEDVEVQLNLSIRALLYNTSQAYYKCGFRDEVCSTRVLFPNGNTMVLTSPASQQDSSIEEWYVKLSYGPRWATYVVGTAVMTLLMLVVFNFLNNYQCFRGEDSRVQYAEAEPERAPLLSYKDDDLSSWGSSYDSVSNDEEEFEDLLVAGSKEGTSTRDGENGNNTRRLCAICFDAPRDCFFLPCGHCVGCFACGTRIAEAAGTCPICRRNIKKVREIFTV